jgi:hypothetical protein
MAHRGLAYVHYNMNIREDEAFGEGEKVHQQDNFLTIVSE